MQLIVGYPDGVENYISSKAHLRIQAPRRCPNCGGFHTLRSLGYYQRGVSHSNSRKVLLLNIKRFRCFHCFRSISLLPSFIHPYRLVSSDQIESFFSGKTPRIEYPWRALLRRYWRRFESWSLELWSKLRRWSGRPPPSTSATGFWEALLSWGGSLSELIGRLLAKTRATIFGRYRCHEIQIQVHTTGLFS